MRVIRLEVLLVDTFAFYLLTRSFTSVTDCGALAWLVKTQAMSAI